MTRVGQWIMVGSISMSLAGGFAVGCGSTTTDNPVVDAGGDTSADVTLDQGAQDTGADVKDSGVACVEDSSIATLSPPDAAIADGASSVGICLGCIKGNCDTELNACAADCVCNNAVEGIIGCVLTGTAITTCGAPLAGLTGNSQLLGLSLGQCLIGNCRAECAPNIDAGQTDSASDAPADAPDAG